MKKRIFVLSLFLFVGNTVHSQEPAADAIYLNGKIYTQNEANPWAQAMAVKGDRFLYVGSNKDAEKYRDKATSVIDLKGAFVMPGMYDLHVHPDLLFEPKYTGQIQTAPLGPEEIKKALLDFSRKHPGKGWIFGGTWAPDAFLKANIEPGAKFLDSFIPDRPVALLETGRHILMVNSLAMKLAGIDANTYSPDHGTIKRDEQGNPTGYFSDGAQSLFSHVIPQGTWKEFASCYEEGMHLLNSYGFVAARSQHVNTPRLQGVSALERNGELTVRYDMAISWKNDLHFSVDDRAALLTGERFRYHTKHVNANYIKLHLDGTVPGFTAYFLDPYKGTKDVYGKTNETRRELYDMMVQLERQRIAANIHVIGDAAARLALDAIEYARKTVNLPPEQQPRHMLAHTFFIRDEDAARAANLNIAVEFTHFIFHPALKNMIAYLKNEIVSPKVVPYLLNIRKVLDSGGHAVFGSDLVVSPDPNVFPSLSRLVNRDERAASITLEEALRMLTINGAWAMGYEKIAGSIEAGKFADFVVLDRNLFKVPVDDIANTKVKMTVFEGDVVYNAEKDGYVKPATRYRTIDVFDLP